MAMVAMIGATFAGAYATHSNFPHDCSDDYYCSYCKSKLSKKSEQVWVNTTKKCRHCGGDGLVNDVDRNGRIIKNAKTCPVCDGGCYEKELTTIYYLHCNKCGRDFDY